MHNVVLINPRTSSSRLPYNKKYAAREPLGIMAIGSFMQHYGYNVKIIDTILYSEDEEKEKVKSFVDDETIFVGFSVMTAQVPHALELSKYLKKIGTKSPIIWGGIHPTLFPEQTSLDPNVDLVVFGPGESTTLEVTRKIESKDIYFHKTKGVAFKGRLNGQRERDDINTFPYFDYDLLDLEHYLGPSPHYLLSETPINALNVLSSRGCPWRCSFCINFATRNRWRALTADRFVDELAYQKNKYKLEAIRILDEDFFVSKKRTTAFIEGLKKRNIEITWGTNARANYFDNEYITLDYAKKLKGAGLKFLTFGAESGSNRVLELIHKDITIEQLLRSAETCADAGIIPIYSWMIGIPGQSKEEMRSNISLINQINEICPNAIHTTNWIFRPLPGGDLYDTAKSLGLNEPVSLSEWASFGVDKEGNTGSYSVYELPWIEDPQFVEFLAIFTPLMRATSTVKLSGKAYFISKILRFIYKTWDWFILGYFSKKTGSLMGKIYDRRHRKAYQRFEEQQCTFRFPAMRRGQPS